MARPRKFNPVVPERAVQMVSEHRKQYGSEWEAISSIAEKIVRLGGSPRSFDGEVSDLKAFWLVSQHCDAKGARSGTR